MNEWLTSNSVEYREQPSTRQLKFVYEFCHAACQLNFILNTEANINMYPPYSRFISEIIIKTGEFVENTYKIETIYIYVYIFLFFFSNLDLVWKFSIRSSILEQMLFQFSKFLRPVRELEY